MKKLKRNLEDTKKTQNELLGTKTIIFEKKNMLDWINRLYVGGKKIRRLEDVVKEIMQKKKQKKKKRNWKKKPWKKTPKYLKEITVENFQIRSYHIYKKPDKTQAEETGGKLHQAHIIIKLLKASEKKKIFTAATEIRHHLQGNKERWLHISWQNNAN